MGNTGQKKIFIIEDNFMYSYVLGLTLKEYGNYSVTSFATGEECISLLDNNPDLIILDYNLQDGMNGLDTFKVIRSKKPKTPVIILSSQTDVKVAVDMLELGAFDYIQKKDKEAAMDRLRAAILKALK